MLLVRIQDVEPTLLKMLDDVDPTRWTWYAVELR